MTDVTRTTLWAVLSEAFQTVLCTLQANTPDVRMRAGHSHNDVFPFRAYAEYSKSDRVVDLSFDVQAKDSGICVSGDIARGDGLVIMTVTDVELVAEACDDRLLIAHATGFASECQQYVDLIAAELDQAGGKKRNQEL